MFRWFVTSFAALAVACLPVSVQAANAPLRADHAVVVSQSDTAFRIRAAVLEEGGSAMDAGRVHHQRLPDRLVYERHAFFLDSLNGLRSIGHALERRDRQGAAAVIVVADHGALEGGVDRRVPDGGAVGY